MESRSLGSLVDMCAEPVFPVPTPDILFWLVGVGVVVVGVEPVQKLSQDLEEGCDVAVDRVHFVDVSWYALEVRGEEFF